MKQKSRDNWERRVDQSQDPHEEMINSFDYLRAALKGLPVEQADEIRLTVTRYLLKTARSASSDRR